MALAAKIPFRHPYAAGFPGLGSQPMPTDADALDYLDRVAAADGASVEVGVATAVSAFFRDTKAAGVFDALKACCILCGARTITGALVPLAGDAPTAQGGWASGDYSRTAGMTGDGNALYLDTNVANNSDFGGSVDDPQNDNHNAVYCSTAATSLSGYLGSGAAVNGGNQIAPDFSLNIMNMRSRRNTGSGSTPAGYQAATGFIGHSRDSAASYDIRISGTALSASLTSDSPVSDNLTVYKLGSFGLYTDATIAFYSIGTSLSLEDLDTAVTNLITAIGEAL